MTTSQRNSNPEPDERADVPAQQARQVEPDLAPEERWPIVLHGRPRSVEGEEAYLRSVQEQAAIDIAAGW